MPDIPDTPPEEISSENYDSLFYTQDSAIAKFDDNAIL